VCIFGTDAQGNRGVKCDQVWKENDPPCVKCLSPRWTQDQIENNDGPEKFICYYYHSPGKCHVILNFLFLLGFFFLDFLHGWKKLPIPSRFKPTFYREMFCIRREIFNSASSILQAISLNENRWFLRQTLYSFLQASFRKSISNFEK